MSSTSGSTGSGLSSLNERASAIGNVAELLGRVFLAAIFLISGLNKIGASAGTAAYMASAGVPGALLPLVITTEVLGAIAIIVGWKTRITAFFACGILATRGGDLSPQLRRSDPDAHVPERRRNRRRFLPSARERRRRTQSRSSFRQVVELTALARRGTRPSESGKYSAGAAGVRREVS